MDVAIPIVFPDYRITVDLPPIEVDLLPWFTFDNLRTPKYKDRWSNLGHAGVLFINGANGLTKYYEYGRYDPQGLGAIKNRPIPNVQIREGQIDKDSLRKPLHQIAVKAGQSGRIQGVYIEVENGFSSMLAYAQLRESQNANPKRKTYDLLTHSCVHFVKDVVATAGVETPWMIDPRPNSYIGEFRDDYPDLDYVPRTRELKIEGRVGAAA
jgi:hypothetical protein